MRPEREESKLFQMDVVKGALPNERLTYLP
jgi:hypothetical protein